MRTQYNLRMFVTFSAEHWTKKCLFAGLCPVSLWRLLQAEEALLLISRLDGVYSFDWRHHITGTTCRSLEGPDLALVPFQKQWNGRKHWLAVTGLEGGWFIRNKISLNSLIRSSLSEPRCILNSYNMILRGTSQMWCSRFHLLIPASSVFWTFT